MNHIKEQHNIDVELSIFPRPISVGRGLAKTTTRALVCEVSEDHAQLVTTALMQYKFPHYTNVKFIPFTRFDDTYTTMLCKIIDTHRQYLQDVEIVRIPKMPLTHDKLSWKTDAYSSVRDLILSCNGTEAAFLHDVDVGSKGSVNIIYFISQEEKLPPFLSQLQQLLCDHISFEALQLMYHYQGSLPGLLNRRRVSQFEREHLSQLKNEYDISNSQESQPPAQQKVSTNAWSTPPQLSTNTTQLNDLTARMKTIENSMNDLSKNSSATTSSQPSYVDPPMSTEDIQNLISTQVSTATTSLRNEFEQRFKNIDGQFTSVNSKIGTIQNSISDLNDSTTKLESSITKLESTNKSLESTNSQILEFLRQHHNLPASGPTEEPRANE